MTSWRTLTLAAVLALAGCGSDKGKPAVTPGTPDGGTVQPSPDAGSDAGTKGDATTAAIKLYDWIEDLTSHYTTPTSAPDTVDDKNIIDTDNPNEFDPLLK
jgi:hypothetical protein